MSQHPSSVSECFSLRLPSLIKKAGRKALSVRKQFLWRENSSCWVHRRKEIIISSLSPMASTSESYHELCGMCPSGGFCLVPWVLRL